jgi:hypothetical protein
MTIEAWISPSQVTSGKPVVEWAVGGNYAVHFWVPGTATGTLYANIFGTDNNNHIIESPAGMITANVFQHIAVTYDKASGNAQLFVNGALVQQASLGSFTPSTATDLYLGYRPSTSPFGPLTFQGLIDEVAIYSRALSSNEIQAVYQAGHAGKCITPQPPQIILQPTNQTVPAGDWTTLSSMALGTSPLSYFWYFNGTNLPSATNASLALTNIQVSQGGTYFVQVTNAYGNVTSSVAVLTVKSIPNCTIPPAGLISWWPADGDASDSVGSNSGTLFGNAAFVPGFVRQAIALDGTNGYMQVPDAPSLNPPFALSIEAWFYLVSFSGTGPRYLVCKDDDGSNREYLINLVPGPSGQPVCRAHVGLPGGYTYITGTNAIQFGTWTHVAETYDGAVLRLYVNGSLDSSLVATGGVKNTTQTLRLGRGTPGYFFNGLIDEVSLYNRALSSAEIQNIYNARAAGKCHVPVAPFVISQPTNQTVTLGSNAVMSITAGGSVPLSYQWIFNGTPLSGATRSSLQFPSIQTSNAGVYSVIVSNATGFVVSSTNAVLTLIYPPAPIRITGTNGVSAGIVTLTVSIAANGIENALGFSLNFDATKLTYVGSVVGSGAPGAVLLANTSQTNSGRVGLAVALPPGASLNPGTQQIAQVTFLAAPLTNFASTPVSFGDSPTIRQLLDGLVNPLSATFGGAATVNISPAGFEGDLFPRPNGDQTISLADWLLMGRYVARLDYPTNTSEFQRADCAPRATLGDGTIRVSDWVQLGRYAFGLDLWSPAGGPTNELFVPVAGPSATRVVTAGALALLPGRTAKVSINLAAQGNENALAFSLSFDARVVFNGAALGPDGAGMTLFVNTNQTASGKIGFAMALGAGAKLAPGPKEILDLTFTASPSAMGSFSPGWADAPVTREISDAAALVLPASYANGFIPSLSISRLGTNVILSWPVSSSGFVLQEANGALTSGGVWTNVPAIPVISNSDNSVTLPLEVGPTFYRLSQ